MNPDFSLELTFRENGKTAIAGVDEVGRGALAGPIVAAAVVFADYNNLISALDGVTDSKKLTAQKRKELDSLIKSLAREYSIAEISAEEIDKYGIGAANIMAFQKALDGLNICDHALIDGRKFRGLNHSYSCFEKGESKSLSIAAASIIAKVYRDEKMIEFAKDFPNYDLENNKGYGSVLHFDGLKEKGLSQIHRQTFVHLSSPQDSLF